MQNSLQKVELEIRHPRALVPAFVLYEVRFRDSGAGCRTRTRDLRFTKALLYQLS